MNHSSGWNRWVGLLPFVVLICLLLLSPNFHWQIDANRQSPYGSDFLQEWIGGQIVRSDQRAKLYDLKYVHAREHNESELGFSWPEDDYYPMVYPPFHYLLVSPFSYFPYRYAVIAWAVFSTLAFSVTGWLLAKFYRPVQDRFTLWFIAMCLFSPWIICLSMGQKSTILLLLFTATFLLLRDRKNFWAGVVFGLVAIKPQLGLVIGAAMIFKRQWSFVAGAGLTVGLLMGVSYLIEPQWWQDYVRVLARMGDYSETAGYRLNDAHSVWGCVEVVSARAK